ncbi:MAG: cadmium resistance transporter [Gammaproteobacteria bacterium]|nr:cadmium resistance transporter [Gammaproteobacteria bacterium]MDH5584030.1 cadmium resistance transporter [Gammaproteobacteria bacterium]
MSELTIIALVAGSYAATNMDNLTILVSWMLAGKTSFAGIASGYAMATIAVLVSSTILGLSSNVIPVELIGYLGVFPIGLGIYSLIGQIRGGSRQADANTGNAAALGVAATLTGNSADSIIIFSPMLADSKGIVDLYIVSAFVVVAAAWFWMAKVASQRVAKLDAVTNVAGWIAPIIMIYVGIYILMNTATDVV